MRNRQRSRYLIALGAATCALALAACGSSGKPGRAAVSANTKQLEFANCMRSHGVPNYPDTGTTGAINVDSAVNPQSPAFQTAAQMCRKFQLGPHGGGEIPERVKLSMFEHAKCMRAHGVPDYPDPNIPSQYPLRVQPPPGINTEAPAFQHAAAACGGE